LLFLTKLKKYVIILKRAVATFFYGVPGDYTDVSVSALAGKEEDYDWASLLLCGGS
jgi:hypothetical protein